MIRKELEHLAINIDDIHTHPSNVRQGDVGAICESLKAHGQYRPIVFQQSTKRILAGNHTWKAAKALGWQQIAATPIICDDQQALRILLADNKANDLATYDEPELVELLKQLADTDEGLLGTLFDEDELDSLIADQSHFELPTDVDDVPEDVPAVSKLGDVWLLGEHRVMCGDSTNQIDANILMLGKFADLLFTDPPYNANYKSRMDSKRSNPLGGIKNDKLEIGEFELLINNSLSLAKNILKINASAYCWIDWKQYGLVADVFKSLFNIKSTIVWDKEHFGMGSYYRTQYELLLFGVNGDDVDTWNSGHDERDVWSMPRESANYVHPTQKPVALAVRALKNSSNENDIVLDLFGGSGSTLIAAQETNRTAYLMELDPHYVDVICARYQKHTGNQPVLEATGEAHDFTPDAD